jgi:hypothetical protein
MLQICQNNFALKDIIITIKKQKHILYFENAEREFVRLP